jgi:hypothetical protein
MLSGYVPEDRLMLVIMVDYQDDQCQAGHQFKKLDDWFDTSHQGRLP